MNKGNLLKNALMGNGIFTILSAFFLLVFKNQLDQLFMLRNNWILYLLSIILFIYGADLLATAIKNKMTNFKVWYFIIMDAAWVAGSLILAAILFDTHSLAALLLIDLVALMVAIFGLMQFMGLKRSRQVT